MARSLIKGLSALLRQEPGAFADSIFKVRFLNDKKADYINQIHTVKRVHHACGNFNPFKM